MAYRAIDYRKREEIAYLTLARPERGNRIDEALLYDLAAACRQVAEDEEVRVLVLAAQGPAFCLGWETTEAEGPSHLGRLRALADGFSWLAQLPQPTIAAIAGDALSAGLELALACDVRIATAEARLGLPEVAQGLIPLAGGSQRLPRLVGRSKALEMVLTAEAIAGQEAWRAGLVNRLAAGESLLAEAEALARRIAQRGPLAVRYAKEALHQGLDMPLGQALRLETDLTIILQTTEDRAEGVRAFLAKRSPRFRGR